MKLLLPTLALGCPVLTVRKAEESENLQQSLNYVIKYLKKNTNKKNNQTKKPTPNPQEAEFLSAKLC